MQEADNKEGRKNISGSLFWFPQWEYNNVRHPLEKKKEKINIKTKYKILLFILDSSRV